MQLATFYLRPLSWILNILITKVSEFWCLLVTFLIDFLKRDRNFPQCSLCPQLGRKLVSPRPLIYIQLLRCIYTFSPQPWCTCCGFSASAAEIKAVADKHERRTDRSTYEHFYIPSQKYRTTIASRRDVQLLCDRKKIRPQHGERKWDLKKALWKCE